MSTKDDNKEITSKEKIFDDAIEELCSLILVNEDELDFENTKSFIERQVSNNVEFIGDKYHIRYLAQKGVLGYIDRSDLPLPVFAFAEDGRFYRYRKEFRRYFEQCLELAQRESEEYPIQFEYLFDFIQESVDFHALHKKFSI